MINSIELNNKTPMKKYATRLEKRVDKETRNLCDTEVQNHKENGNTSSAKTKTFKMAQLQLNPLLPDRKRNHINEGPTRHFS